MWYLIIGSDVPNSLEARRNARAGHLQRLQVLASEQRLLVAGPLPALDMEDPGESGYVGSAIIAKFDSFAAAREWADADPYFLAGVYQQVDVLPFKPVLP
ncbi:MAG: YciI-like protein [Alphaproteobacteria bacterium ADurb.BinA280]|jgi:uncharacterized protein YciI|nr:YciI family protein [Xanthomonadales bacterium]MCC6504574.1 YciI family protein [Aquimonas sp.]OPZ11271.1 MAG: YciI-like protein [Alphaproteobacteria bacterium ADurb.BinA280]